jgi:hypothetical protein
MWIGLEGPNGKFEGPCLVDTGFDGALYASEDLALLLESASPTRRDYLYTVGDHEIECEVFPLRAYLVAKEGRRKLAMLGLVETLVPTRPNDLSDVTIIGRKVLNSLVVRLDGKKLDVL